MSVQNDWLLRVRAYQKILCQAFHAIPRETGAYFDILLTLLYRSIYALFVDFVLVSTFHYKTTKKVSVFFKQKKMAVEPGNQEDRLDEDSEAEGVSSTSSQPPELQEPTASNSTITVRKFRLAWKNVYPWLQYDEEKGMPCSICVRHRKNNTFTKGTNNFRSSTLERHVAHHRQTTLWVWGRVTSVIWYASWTLTLFAIWNGRSR